MKKLIQYIVFGFQFVVCSLQYAVFSMQYVVRSTIIQLVKILPTAYCPLPTGKNCQLEKTAHCILEKTAHWKKLLTAFCLLLFCQLAFAQLHPVQVNQTLVPPYNTKLNSYATATDVKIRLYLTLNDVNVSNRQVRLKLKIKGQRLNIQSTDFVVGAPLIYLNGGSQRQFTNIDLAPYFQLNNLLGINQQQYNQPLPEGMYKVCWEVYDYVTNQLISNPNLGCEHIYLLLNDPPFLNMPNRGDQIADIKPTNIIFQWTPRHANATNVTYEFELRELWDAQIDPQAGFLSSPNYHAETTRATTLLYNVSKPQLLSGHAYAWRVRAKSTTGLSENAVFKNDGYSEIFYFNFTNNCYPPTFTLAEPLNTGMVKISWQTSPEHNKYHVQYKRADIANAEWFEVSSYGNQAQIANLQAGVTYNFRVGGSCNTLTDLNQAYTYSTINQFTMPTPDKTVSYSCGIVPEIEITNTNPLGNIGVNETFTAGDFPVTITSITPSGGSWEGEGFTVVPYLADIKIAVTFSGIKINTDYQLYDGIIKTTYDPDWKNVDDIQDEIDAIAEIPQAIGELTDLIAELFKKREQRLEELQQLQEDLANEIITQEEFDKETGDLVLADQKDIDYYNGQIKDNVLNSPYATEKQKEEVENLGPTALADNNDLSNADIQAISEQDAIRKANMQEIEEQVAQQEKEVKDYLFSILMALKAMDGDAFVKCKQCDKVKDGSTGFDGEVTYAVVALGGKTLKCLLGTLAETELPEITRFTQETFTEEQKQVFEREFAVLTDLVEIDKKEQFLVVSPKNDVLRECTIPLTFPDDYCDKGPNDEVTEEEKGYLASELLECLQTTPTIDIANTVTFTNEEAIDYDGLKQQLQKQLGNTFYNEVKLAVHVTRNGNTETLLSNGLANANEAEITLHIDVDETGKTVSIGTIVSDSYLNHYVSKLQEEARRRGIDVDVEELRQQVLLDLQEKQTMGWFADLAQKTKSLFNEKVGTFLEALQASQKIVKNVWDDGEINRSTWHSTNPEHKDWPAYTKFQPLIGGGTDGVIDEIVGIPIAIKGVYGIMTDPQQREAFTGIFSEEGFKQLWQGIKSEASDIANDAERSQHFGSKATVQVATMVVPGMQITKVGKLGDVLETATKGAKSILNGKSAQILEKLKTANRYKPEILKAIESFVKEIDPKILDKLSNIPNFEKVLADMAQVWSKYQGGKFVLEHLSKKGDDFLTTIATFEGKIDDATNFVADVIRRTKSGELIGYLEYKSWKISSFKYLHGEQSIKQFKNYLQKGEFEYIFDKNKLLKEVSDPEKFVKEQFQEVFKKHANELFDQNPNFFKDNDILTKFELESIAKNNQLINSKILNFIKVE